MPIRIDIDDEPLKEAKERTGIANTREVLEQGLRKLIGAGEVC